MLTLPTRELVGLLADVHPFADPDDEMPTWHRVVIRWDGERLHALAGSTFRVAWMSWGPDDGDAPIPGLEYPTDGMPWELAILPKDAKEIATKFKVGTKDGDAPLRVTGSADKLTVERDADVVGVALRSVAMARPWDDEAPDLAALVEKIRVDSQHRQPRTEIAYSGFALADFASPKVVRQRGPLELRFGSNSTYIKIGEHFQGAIAQATVNP
jgi:hypothetical protein